MTMRSEIARGRWVHSPRRANLETAESFPWRAVTARRDQFPEIPEQLARPDARSGQSQERCHTGQWPAPAVETHHSRRLALSLDFEPNHRKAGRPPRPETAAV